MTELSIASSQYDETSRTIPGASASGRGTRRPGAVEVLVLPTGRVVGGAPPVDVELAGPAVVERGRSLARATELHAVVDGGRYVDLKRVRGAPAAFAAAVGTESAEHAFAVTF